MKMIVIITIFASVMGHLTAKGFQRYVYPVLKRKRPSMMLADHKPLSCEYCMVFWFGILGLTLLNFYNGFQFLTQLLYIGISLLNMYIYEQVKSILLR